MYKIDLHTHSSASPDGGISAQHYAEILSNKLLDYIAITDHNSISYALQLKKNLADKIIVGEEIDTKEGELIGLFLNKLVKPQQSAKQTALAIKKQGGLVYVPHPFETTRHGLSKKSLLQIIDLIDIIEVHNGRALFNNKGPQAATVARLYNKPGAASSDAHGLKGLLSVYSEINQKPTSKNLPKLIATARLFTRRPPLSSLLYPKINRLKKRIYRG